VYPQVVANVIEVLLVGLTEVLEFQTNLRCITYLSEKEGASSAKKK